MLKLFTYMRVIGIVVIMAMLYIMILMIIFNRENRCDRLIDTLNWVLVGVIIGIFAHWRRSILCVISSPAPGKGFISRQSSSYFMFPKHQFLTL